MGDVGFEKDIEELKVLVKQLSDKIMEMAEVMKASMDVQKAMVEVLQKEDVDHVVDTDEAEEKEKELADASKEREADAKAPAEEPKPENPSGDDGISHTEEAEVAKAVETPAPNSDELKKGLRMNDMTDFEKALVKVLRKEISIDEFMKLV